MKWIAAVASSLGIVLTAPAWALAAGGPVPPVQGQPGVAVAGSPDRFIALHNGRDTLVERVTGVAQHVRSRLRIRGRYGVPGAGFDGSTTGLSADGRTLVLEALWPSGASPRTTRLLVLDTRPFQVTKTITLSGWSTVDAISPDGRWLYLIHYRGSNLSKYEVLAYDLPHGRLLPEPIVDPHDRGEAMTGIPMSRVMSADGRWAYTFYGRPSGEPFVHALDTTGVRAVCIDLPSLKGSDFGTGRLRLGPGGSTLQISIGGVVRAVVNTQSFAVSSAGPAAAVTGVPRPARSASHSAAADDGASLQPWEIVLPITALVALAVGVWWVPRRRAT